EIAIHPILQGQLGERVDPLADRTFKKAGGWPVSDAPADVVEPLNGGRVATGGRRGGVDALLHLGQVIGWHVGGGRDPAIGEPTGEAEHLGANDTEPDADRMRWDRAGMDAV